MGWVVLGTTQSHFGLVAVCFSMRTEQQHALRASQLTTE